MILSLPEQWCRVGMGRWLWGYHRFRRRILSDYTAHSCTHASVRTGRFSSAWPPAVLCGLVVNPARILVIIINRFHIIGRYKGLLLITWQDRLNIMTSFILRFGNKRKINDVICFGCIWLLTELFSDVWLPCQHWDKMTNFQEYHFPSNKWLVKLQYSILGSRRGTYRQWVCMYRVVQVFTWPDFPPHVISYWLFTCKQIGLQVLQLSA